MDEETINLALAITQQFGPQRGISREERIRKAKPGITNSEIDEALCKCDEIEAYAYDLAGKFAGGEIDIDQFRSKLKDEFPLLNEKRIDKTLSQALYFSSK